MGCPCSEKIYSSRKKDGLCSVKSDLGECFQPLPEHLSICTEDKILESKHFLIRNHRLLQEAQKDQHFPFYLYLLLPGESGNLSILISQIQWLGFTHLVSPSLLLDKNAHLPVWWLKFTIFESLNNENNGRLFNFEQKYHGFVGKMEKLKRKVWKNRKDPHGRANLVW